MDLMGAAVETVMEAITITVAAVEARMEAITIMVMIGVWQPPPTPDLLSLQVELLPLYLSPSDKDRLPHHPLLLELSESKPDPDDRLGSSVLIVPRLLEYPLPKHLGLPVSLLDLEQSIQVPEEVEVVYSTKCLKLKVYPPEPIRLIQMERLVLGIMVLSSPSIHLRDQSVEVPLLLILIDLLWRSPIRLRNT